MDRHRLFSYHQWATLECLRHVQSLGEELYRREGQNSFASIEKTMEHVIGVEKLWLMRMAATENKDNQVQFPLCQIGAGTK